MFHGEIHGPLWAVVGGGEGRCREQGVESIPSEMS